MFQDDDLDPMINPFVLNMNELKKNKDILLYLREHYNNNSPIITKKRMEDIFYRFEMDCCCMRMNKKIYNLISKLN